MAYGDYDLLTVPIDAVGEQLREWLGGEQPPMQDIGILRQDGTLAGVIISKEYYDFFLQKIEEEDDRLDLIAAEEYEKTKGDCNET